MPPPIGSGMGHLATNQVIRSDFRRDIHSIFHRFYSNSAVWNSHQKRCRKCFNWGCRRASVIIYAKTWGGVKRGCCSIYHGNVYH
eukprot:UN03069